MFEAPSAAIGRLRNAVGPDNARPGGQVELVLDDVLVPHPALDARKSVFLARKLEPDNKKYLFLIDVFKGNIDAYSCILLDDKGEIERYLRGGLQLKDKSQVGRMRYAAKYLNSPCKEVAASADLEFQKADYASLRKVAETLNPDVFVKPLGASETTLGQLGTQAMLLGHCGKKEHAVLLRKLIDAHSPKGGSHLEGLHFGYVLLDPKNGWDLLVQTTLQKDQSFTIRYHAYRTLRRIGEDRPDLFGAKQCAAAIARILDHSDMADLAVETLRLWKRWEYSDAVLDMHGKAGFGAPVIRRTVLRFALQCPLPAAKTFVLIERARDPESVAEAEELLALETELDPAKK